MAQYQNIVIIGGHATANELVPLLPATHRILLIDALEYAFWPIAALRAAVVPGWEDKVTLPLTTVIQFKSDSPHQVLAPNRVVQLKQNSVVLEHPFEGSTELPFFKAIIATGSKQPSPMRPSDTWTMDGYRGSLRQTQEDIRRAQRVVVVGGGTVGVEFAGEVRAAHPDKHLTIVHSHSSLLAPKAPDSSSTKGTGNEPANWSSPPTHPKLSVALEKVARANGVELILDDKVVIPSQAQKAGEWDGSFGLQDGLKTLRLASGKTVQADYVFLSVGNQPNSDLVAKADRGAVLAQGLVAVDQYLRVVSSNPASPLAKTYYAAGDVSSSPGLKTGYGASLNAKGVATNVVNEIQNKALVAYNPGTFGGLFVPFGPNLGAGSITIPYLGTWVVGATIVRSLKGQKLLVNMWQDSWKGEEKVVIDV